MSGQGHAALVLVHGGWLTGACWKPVLPHLSTTCLTPDLPGRAGRPADLTTLTIGDLARAVADDIDAAGLDHVVLVGHSLAGVVIPQVASLLPHRIRRLVFLSATVPREGTSALDGFPPLIRAAMRRRLRSGLSPRPARVLARWSPSHLVEDAAGPLLEPVSRTGLPAVPRTYIRLRRDRALPITAQQRQITHLGDTDITDLDCGHLAMYEQPARLASLLDHLTARKEPVHE
ncbi:alpha/beta hydrolase [Streptomyces sp. TRM72054]|uniref:alpha/beta fold hydrolase n=1 Tax=Streptomyces sp. TRM72054 TaxID=2870562 RepID=UPI001C8CE30E|nr:alpha/beta fold hydrolase [Streptomyces sp. TRM72054]MBX9396592.1 alpha/beta hydrolase [Streptomyces sp. TRM72054]